MRRLASSTLSLLREYGARLRMFQPNARLYLLYIIIVSTAMGVFRLLFNFFVLSLGYDEALLGRFVTVTNLTSLLAALPMGYLADRIGRARSLLSSGLITSLSILAMVLWPEAGILYLANLFFGLSQSLSGVTMGPFLMENSSEEERTYLFSFNSGLSMLAASIGNWIGGYLPTWMGTLLAALPTDSHAYGGALFVVGVAAGVGLLPLLFLRTPKSDTASRSVFAPVRFALDNPGLLGKLILPMLITSIGAGLIMPFMNVFFREVYGQPDPVIGSLFAWGSLAMGLGLLAAPPLADRMGKIQLVVITQGLSIPFLALLGFSPWFALSAAAYYIRVALMNMSGPVYQAFVLEKVDASSRAMVASLTSMSWNFGWAFSPMVSGWLQVHYGFGPAFLGTIILYTISVWMYWAYFWRPASKARLNPVYTK